MICPYCNCKAEYVIEYENCPCFICIRKCVIHEKVTNHQKFKCLNCGIDIEVLITNRAANKRADKLEKLLDQVNNTSALDRE